MTPPSESSRGSRPRQGDRHHHLVDVVAGDLVVVLPDGLDLPAVGLQEGDGALVGRGDGLVDLLVAVRAGPLEAAFEEVAPDAVAPVGL